MAFKKTLLFFILFLLITVPFYVFVILLPVGEFNRIYTNASSMANDFINKAYPEDLIIDIKNGEVSINKKTPYCLVVDEKSKAGILFDENADALALMNKGSTSYPVSCKPFALVGKNFVVYPDTESGSEGAYEIQTISSSVNYKITRDVINELSLTILPIILNVGKYAYYLGPFVLALLMLPFYLIRNLWYALVVMLIFKWTKIDTAIKYSKAYAKSFFVYFIYSVFDMVVIQYLINHVLHVSFSISFIFSTTIIVTLGTILLEKYYFKKNQVTPANPPPAPLS